MKRILKLNTDENWTTLYEYVDLATLIYNTSYHSSIGCTPSSLFHDREPIKPIDLRFRSHALAQKELTSDYPVDLQVSLLENFSHTSLDYSMRIINTALTMTKKQLRAVGSA